MFSYYFKFQIQCYLPIHDIFDNLFFFLSQCLVIKEQSIEVSSDEMDYDIIVPKIETGACYEIMNFRTNKMRGQYRVVLHDTHVMSTAKTVFNKLTSVFPPIPRHIFFFARL